MGRSLAIVAVVGLLMMSGVATASPRNGVDVPIVIGVGTAGEDGTSVVVEPGDHLWKISEQHLGESGSTEVAPYWRRVVVLNEPTLRSGDPDLIYPGETIRLPPINGQP